jgi:predicted ATP-dependent endonuclease of OLD family
MGSGIKTILLVLLNLITRPEIENTPKGSYVFAFEELENSLHPALQRRLYKYIKKYCEDNFSYFFITTHSNIIIDTFGTYENAQLVHVFNDGEKSVANTVLSYSGSKHLLNDLGLRASDILQSNGVIWVEGPSDRNYLNKWLEILAPDLNEGTHYSIMFYGGRLLANLTFDFDWFNIEVIPLLKINKNAFVIIDRDGSSPSSKLNETKKRISQEIGDNHCWITKGREIENYLPDEVISKWLLEKYNYTSHFINNKDLKMEENIANSNDKIKIKYNLSKTVYSSEIIKFIDKTSIEVMDLKDSLEKVIFHIREWNE